MKTESEIREEIDKLEGIAANLRNSGTKPYPIMGALSALRWALNEGVGNCSAGLESSAPEGREPISQSLRNLASAGTASNGGPHAI